jgi:outer membrane protein OmpU
MTNIKKLGLTALAGSLVATSAFAGELAVTGTAKLIYVSQHETEHTGNPYSMNKDIGFAGSGDLDNGMSISYNYLMTNATFSTAHIKLDMGDMGALSFSDNTSKTGISAYADKMPTAGEQVWDDVGDGTDSGVTTISNDGTLGYAGSFGPLDISASYNKDDTTSAGATDGSSYSIVLAGSPMDGVSVFYGQGDKSGTTSHNGTDMWTTGITYVAGAVTVGLQQSSVDATATDADIDRTHYAASFAVNENLSVSYGSSTVEFESNSKVDETSTGFAASYTMGSMTLAAFRNNVDDEAGTSGAEDTTTEISLAFAF